MEKPKKEYGLISMILNMPSTLKAAQEEPDLINAVSKVLAKKPHCAVLKDQRVLDVMEGNPGLWKGVLCKLAQGQEDRAWEDYENYDADQDA